MRVAVLSDIHSNLVALEAVLTHAGSVDAVWQLGDVVGYGPHPDEVVARLAEVGAVGVLGNHDAAALGGPEIDWFNREAALAAAWTRDTIRPETRAWLAALPETTTIEGFGLVHGSHRDPLREYVTDTRVARDNLAELDAPVGLHGHTHVPVAWIQEPDDERVTLWPARDGDRLELEGRRALLNPGSVGQPRDGLPTASYAILEPETGTLTWHRVAYDIAAVQSAMHAVGLPARLADRLAMGR